MLQRAQRSQGDWSLWATHDSGTAFGLSVSLRDSSVYIGSYDYGVASYSVGSRGYKFYLDEASFMEVRPNSPTSHVLGKVSSGGTVCTLVDKGPESRIRCSTDQGSGTRWSHTPWLESTPDRRFTSTFDFYKPQLAIGGLDAQNEGHAYLYELSPTGEWVFSTSFTSSLIRQHGATSVALGPDLLFVGSFDEGGALGQVEMFSATGGWQLRARVAAAGHVRGFGRSMSFGLGRDTHLLVVGASGADSDRGSVHVFSVTSTLTRICAFSDTVTGSHLGFSVALDRDDDDASWLVVVGAPGTNSARVLRVSDDAGPGGGLCAFVDHFGDGSLGNGFLQSGDRLGHSVAISGQLVLVGAPMFMEKGATRGFVFAAAYCGRNHDVTADAAGTKRCFPCPLGSWSRGSRVSACTPCAQHKPVHSSWATNCSFTCHPVDGSSDCDWGCKPVNLTLPVRVSVASFQGCCFLPNASRPLRAFAC